VLLNSVPRGSSLANHAWSTDHPAATSSGLSALVAYGETPAFPTREDNVLAHIVRALKR